MAIPIGINGFGRIGKCTFLQLLESNDFSIKAINTSFALTSIEAYINHDSVHGSRNYKVNIVDENHIQVKGHVIRVLNSRVPGATLPFRECGVRILFETTGAFLTKEKLEKFEVDYVVLSAPPKDIGVTPM
jgi:glyceraldehyde 3-phosphate dehydrogenase